MTTTTDEPLIVTVIRSYFPDWEAPPDRGREWVSALCPFHGDNTPSASVSYVNNAFKCFACDEKGDAITILMRKEGISYREAVEYAEELSPGCHDQIRGESSGKSGRRVFGDAGTDRSGLESRNEVQGRLRGRSSPWT